MHPSNATSHLYSQSDRQGWVPRHRLGTTAQAGPVTTHSLPLKLSLHHQLNPAQHSPYGASQRPHACAGSFTLMSPASSGLHVGTDQYIKAALTGTARVQAGSQDTLQPATLA